MATSSDAKYIVADMSTVIVVPVDGVNLKKPKELEKIEAKVEAKVKEIVNKLKASHEKFEDCDFGPTEKDTFGAISFYGFALPAPAGSKYPAPESLKWERPLYEDTKFVKEASEEGKTTDAEEEEEEVEESEFDDDFGFGGCDEESKIWCEHGKLFVDGASSGDVIQGQLGDCWFLSALAVMGANEDLLKACFWKAEAFKEYGLYVMRFYKDCNVIYVIVDDRLPVKAKDGRIIFAGNKDPNELWVPLIEKAYAKLHGCYKALIGGYTHNGLADMTGFCPRLIVMREGFLGYSEKYDPDQIWALLMQYKKWNSLMGCSIQSNPKEKQKVEADAGHGLHMGHAYSLLNMGEIDVSKGTKAKPGAPPKMLRLVKLRNPWGRGEWEGPFGDRSDEREEHNAEIERVFNANEREQERAEVNFNDGTFFMTFEAWMQHYTSLFVAVNFPPEWTGKRTQGKWSGDQGGNRDMGTWISNPKFKFRLERSAGLKDTEEEHRQVFVGLYIKDSRLTMGGDYYKDPLYATSLAFDIVTAAEMAVGYKGNREFIPFSHRSATSADPVKQPPYNFGTTQVDVFLKTGVDYFIVPSLHKRNQAGTFYLNVFADAANFHLDGSMTVSDAQQPMVIGSKEETKVELKMSVGQYYDRKEQLRERIVAEAKRLNLSAAQLETKFCDVKEKLTLSAFKRRMMDMGFMLTDFPDSDLVVLDADNDGTISHTEFIEFFREGLKFTEVGTVAPPPEAPVDDLLYKAVDLSGELTVSVDGARALREATTWFNSLEKSEAMVAATTGKNDAAASAPSAPKVDPSARRLIKYDPVEAQKMHKATFAERQAALEAVLNASPKPKTAPAAAPSAKPSAGAAPTDLGATLTAPLTLDNLTTHNSMGQMPFASPKSVNPRGHNKPNHDAGSAMTGMSVAKLELLQKVGKDAAVKLHSDASLQKAEVARTKFLGQLRNHAKNKEGADSKQETGMLRKKTKHVAKKEKRDIMADIDARIFLNYCVGDLDSVAVAATGDVATRTPTVYPSAPSPLTKGMSMSARLVSQNSTILRSALSPVNIADAAGRSLTKTMSMASVNLPGAAAGVPPASGRYKAVTSDLWDYLIDCVVTISVSRPRSQVLEQQRAVLHSKNRRVTAQGMALFDPPRTPIPAPSTKVAPARPVKGTAATPRTTRHTPGHASVTSAQSKSKQQTTILDAKDRLQKVEKDIGPVYEEVYRRLVRMPVTSHNELEGDREAASASGNSVAAKSHTYLRALFERFDKNLNGYISKDEFKIAMADINVEVSSEDCDIFFNRFKGERPDNIDWKEFIRFFDTHLTGTTTAASRTPSKSVVPLLMTLKVAVSSAANRMVDLRIATLENLLSLQSKTVPTTSAVAGALVSAAPGTAEKNKPFVLPDNAIFQNLSTTPTQVKTNVGIMQKLGVTISEEEMACVSRIFLCKVSVLMAFVRNPQQELDLFEVLDIADGQVTHGLLQRTGATNHASSIAKLWSSLAPNLNTTVGFEAVATYLTTMLLEANVLDEEVKLSPRAPDIPITTRNQACIRGIDAHILCRIIADTLVYSSWNRDSAPAASAGSAGAGANCKDSAQGAGFDLKGSLSFSGLDAYVRNNRINFIERKLKYLMQLEANYSGAEIYLLVHVYFSVAQDEAIVLALDPLSGDIFKMGFKEDLKHLPMGEKLTKMFMNTPKHEEFVNKRLNSNVIHYYNPWDTPAEDAAVSDLVNRLRLVRSRTSSAASTLILAEEPKFVSSLKTLLDNSASLPFFSILNDLTLTFEVHDEKLLDHASIRSFVFGNIRNYKPLCSFLEGVSSSLNVVLATYNGGIRETFKWKELLSHLSNHRNPFFTIQLLPAFLEPEQYIYTPEDNTSAFTGDDDVDESCPKLKSAVDQDGAPHPAWDSSFKFNFQPPQLTACKVLSTEITKVKVDDKYKYVVLMARQGKRTVPGVKDKRPFKFLTVYDPRSATDFQCGVKPGCQLYDLLYTDKDGNFAPQVDTPLFMQCVAEAGEQDKIIVGPAITPRLEINVYNECGRNQELLGSCQVSVSAVLSGSGISDKQRVCLTYRQEMPNGKAIDAFAGDIQLEMRFRGQLAIEAEKEAEARIAASGGSKAVAGDQVAAKAPRGAAKATSGTAATAGKDGDAVGKLDDLRTENDTLALETKKLKEKLASTAAQMEEMKTTGVNAALNAELKAAQEEKDRLAEEKKKVEAEKAALTAQLAKLAEDSKKEIAALKAANEQALQKAAAGPAATAPVDPTTTREYLELAAMLAEARGKLEGGQPKTGKVGDSVTSLPPLSKSSSRVDVEGGPRALVRIEDDSLLGTVHGIINEFLTRHERKNAGGNALDSLQRLLSSYAKPDGTIVPKDLVTALSDVMIGVSMEQATKIAREVGMTPSNNHFLVSALMSYLSSELHQILLNRKRRRTRGAASAEAGTLSTSVDDIRSIPDVPKVHRPARPSSAQVKPSAEEAGPKVRMSQSNKHALNATDGDVGRARPRAAGGIDSVASATTPLPAASPARRTPAVGSPGAQEHDIDWTLEPLPPHWERKLPKGTSRYVYINHETKKTQWNHPLDTSHTTRRHRRRHQEATGEGEAVEIGVPAPTVQEPSPRAPKEAVAVSVPNVKVPTPVPTPRTAAGAAPAAAGPATDEVELMSP